MDKYGEILHMKRPVSKKYKAMSMEDRAAQFAPFAALDGHKESIDEAGRYLEKRVELSRDRLEKLNQKISYIIDHIDEAPEIEVTYFKADPIKNGGKYVKEVKKLKKYNEYKRKFEFYDKMSIEAIDIYDINSDYIPDFPEYL